MYSELEEMHLNQYPTSEDTPPFLIRIGEGGLTGSLLRPQDLFYRGIRINEFSVR
jgi:hypothetical protein